MENKTTDFILLILIICLIGGFYLVLDKTSKTEEAIQNLTMNLRLQNKNLNNSIITPKENDTTSTTDSNIDQDSNLTPITKNDILIPTAIIFQTNSSPLLSPQTEITVSVEKLIKEKDTGIIRIYLKTFTNKTNSYSALEPGNLFEVVNPGDQNQKSLKVSGNFSSIPPQSSVIGEITFKIKKNQDNVVISVESNDGKKYYKFNFEKQNYQETTLG